MNTILSSLLAAVVLSGDAAKAPVLRPETGVIGLSSGDRQFDISLRCPMVRLAGDAGLLGGEMPEGLAEVAGQTDTWQCTYPPAALADGSRVDRVLYVAWSPPERVLRKWLRLRLHAAPDAPPIKVEEVILETIAAPQLTRDFRPGPPQSYPLFFDGFFAGIEFPVAATRLEEGQAILSHRPFCVLPVDSWYESRRAVYGAARAGQEVLAFHEYIEAHRPAPKGMHFNYNSWWTSPVPFSEADILALMKVFEENLYKRHDVPLDSFTIDLGWSDPRGVWDINRALFPDEFTRIQAGAEAMGARLGLWTSPSSYYPPAVDLQTALDAGYERGGPNVLSLAGEKYREKYASTIADYTARFRLAQIKLDGLYLGGADFLAGEWPAEATAAGAAEAFDRMRAAGPDAWLEATYSAYASPWWLFHVNSVIGCFGDDSPHGRVPCPVYRESYTTARDFFNLQGADRLPSPIPAQEILGIIHQSDDCFMNDAITTVLRGHAFIPLYLNPKYMNELRWDKLARLITWSRANSDLLTAPDTQPLRPPTWLRDGTPWLSHDAPMPREPYGYAHWGAERSLVLLRNPWIRQQSYTLKVAMPVTDRVHAISLYPEARVYHSSLVPGESCEVSLAPYETVVLAFAAGAPPAGLPAARDVIGGTRIRDIPRPQARVQRVIYELPDVAHGVDYTSLAPESGEALEVDLDFAVPPGQQDVRRRVFVLLEAPAVPQATSHFHVNGQELPLQSIRSDSGFVATGAPLTESWQFLEGELPPSGGQVSLRVLAADTSATMSIWVWADKAGGSVANRTDVLPSPERISLDSVCLFEPMPLTAATQEERRPAPLVRIDGVYLDTLDPVSVRQGWGTLQKKRSVWERDMVIGQRHFRRGLGTHADGEIAYALDGRFRRFLAWVGPDMATHGSLGFTVVVDGQERWTSGTMHRGDEAKLVDIDISGARELRLLVDDAGDSIAGDHANWADAQLLH